MKLRLPIEIALSTLEAEHVALSTTSKDLYAIVDMVFLFHSAVGLSCEAVPQLHVKVHKDNAGALNILLSNHTI